MMPSQAQVRIPLLRALFELGGHARPKDIYPRVTAMFPQLTEEVLAETVKHGERKWLNRIQWTRQPLITSGDLERPTRGIWAITEEGSKRLKLLSQSGNPPIQSAVLSKVSLVELNETYDLQFRSKLFDKLYELASRQFEHFAR